MSKFIIKKKGEGKTTELIKIAAEQGLYIVCLDRERAINIFNVAKQMGCPNIPFPITLDEILLARSQGEMPIGAFYGRSKGRVLVDDVEDIMSGLVGMSCSVITGTLDKE